MPCWRWHPAKNDSHSLDRAATPLTGARAQHMCLWQWHHQATMSFHATHSTRSAAAEAHWKRLRQSGTPISVNTVYLHRFPLPLHLDIRGGRIHKLPVCLARKRGATVDDRRNTIIIDIVLTMKMMGFISKATKMHRISRRIVLTSSWLLTIRPIPVICSLILDIRR